MLVATLLSKAEEKHLHRHPVQEQGLRALAGGIKSVGDAMKEKATAGADILPSREVVASLTHQEEALKQQTAAINELIGTLREKQ
ncbi:hypothetical protein L917_09533 [Phytophthora nicotianae]|nr:hypothetical protein L917_09533 [Phytophthora nicotianae]